jgi:subtilase-type serine protease
MEILSLYRGAPGARALGLIALGLGSSCLTPIAHADPAPTIVVPLDFGTNVVTLDYGNTGTFLTGIRGDNIVGNYTIPSLGTTGGLYYNLTSGTWSAMPVETPNGTNYPGSTGSSPYGPSFGNPGGVLRVVGSYLTSESDPYDLSYLYDAAAAPGQELTELVYPDSGTLYTIAHSTFGNQVVGNYDTQLDEGHAFIYNIDTGGYTPLDYSELNQPEAVSTTAYGIYGDKIAGGYTEAQLGGGGLGPQHGYIYDQVTGLFKRYDNPGVGVVATHFEGITGGGQPGTYNLVANWVTADLEVHAGIMHLAADGTVTWYEFDMPGADVVSSNSAYGDKVVGIYTDADGIHGYVATIDGIYNPTVNTVPINTDASGPALEGQEGEDIINSANITVTGAGGVGIRGETYGVITNSATISASGLAGAAVEMHGRFGTLLNSGTLQTTSPEADVLRTDLSAEGTIIVNTGIIDGRLALTAGAGKRFENSGWLGVSGAGVSIEHLFLGTMVNTAAGTYAARITDDGRDRMIVDGALRLDGTLAVTFQTDTIQKSYALMKAAELTGAFETIDAGIFAGTADYSGNTVTLNLSAADLATRLGLTANQHAVGSVIDGLVNTPGDDPFNALPDALAPLYGLTAGQVPGALDALSGEAYASQQSVLIGDGFYVRQSILERLRQGSYAGQQGPAAGLGYGSAVLAYGPDDGTPELAATGPVYNHTFWAQGFGVSADYDGGSDTSAVDATMGGIIAGVDMIVDNWLVGAALGYTQSSSDVDELNSSSDVDSALVALYAATSFGPRNLRFGGSYAFSQVDASRTIAYPGYSEQANADYNAGVGQVFAEVSQAFAAGQVALEPFAGLAYVHVATDSFTETGASAGLSADSSASGLGYSSLGIRAATTMQLASGMALKPHAGLTWQHAFGDVTPEAQMAFISVPSASFTVAGAPLARDAALVELGLDLDLTPQASIGVSYLGQYGDDVTVNALQADLRLSF